MIATSAYVHFPWCLQKCPYCDFATRATDRRAIPQTEYTESVIRELSLRRDELAGRFLASIFVGGGTPSLWEPAQLARVLEAVRGAFAKEAEQLEVTVECNPSSLDAARAKDIVSAGATRLSIGVQALDDATLRFLGRLHDVPGALAAVDAALAAAPRASADLIFAVHGRGAIAAARDAGTLAERGLRHVSTYALTIEPATQFGALAKKGKLPIATEDEAADAFLAVRDTLEARGLRHYEVSNHAVHGEESVHNLHYWRGGDYLGLGAGAVGCLSRDGAARRWRNDPDGATYVERLRASPDALPEVETETLDAGARTREALMLGLRTTEGVDLAALEARTGIDVRATQRRTIERLEARGELSLDAGVLRVPPGKWLVLDSVVRELF